MSNVVMVDLADDEIRGIARKYGLSVLQARRISGQCSSEMRAGIAAAYRLRLDDALEAFLRRLGILGRRAECTCSGRLFVHYERCAMKVGYGR